MKQISKVIFAYIFILTATALLLVFTPSKSKNSSVPAIVSNASGTQKTIISSPVFQSASAEITNVKFDN